MSTLNDGGPAFPTGARCATHHLPNGEKIVVEVNGIEQAMSLRDWFAGQAIAGRLIEPDSKTELIGVWAYQIADAMLAAREKGPQ